MSEKINPQDAVQIPEREAEFNRRGNIHQRVYIPAMEQHEGIYGITIDLEWICPICGEKRGKVFKTSSFDGSRVLHCDGWINACGHLDRYQDVRLEASINGLNRRRQPLDDLVVEVEQLKSVVTTKCKKQKWNGNKS